MFTKLRLASGAGLAGLILAGSSGCSGDQTQTGTTVTKPPEAAAGEKASIDFMKKNMGRGGMTKSAASPKS
jgi:hypothetical protein